MPPLVRSVARLQWPFDIRPTDTQIFHHFKAHDLITCELVGFVRPWELVSFDPGYVTPSPPIGKRS